MSSSVGRRSLLGAGLGLAVAPAVAAQFQTSASAAAPAGSGFATFRWLGVAGWDIRTPQSRLLVDPYLSRFDTGLGRGAFDPATSLHLDPTRIDAALGQDAVTATFVTHTHWDHFADVPHIASSRGGTVFTTLSGYHLGQVMGLAASKLAVVKGGEELHVGDVVVRVVRSLHSRTGTGGLLFPGIRTANPPAPGTIADLPEGDTLSFLIRSPEGRKVLLLGASDFDDQALAGLAPQAVVLPVPSSAVTAGYVRRVMEVLDAPGIVVPVHWDDFESAPTNPPTTSDAWRSRLAQFIDDVKSVSPSTRVVIPDYERSLALL